MMFGFLFAQSKPYVILISFDGFRWDYSERGITPNIQKMKDRGVTAKSLRPCFPSKTFPNHLSIITGMYTENHGIISNNMRDLSTGEEYNLGNRSAVRNSSWYKGIAFWELAEKNKVRSASFFWPSSDVTDPTRRPTFSKIYEHDFPYKNRIDTVLHWLTLPYSERPHFITTYFHDTDSYGHEYGPNSPEINLSIMRLDSLIGILNNGLFQIGLQDSVNIILLSDHGMTEIYEDKIIEVKNLLSVNNCRFIDEGPFLMIEPEKSLHEKIYMELKSSESHYSVYKKENIPEYYHYSNNDLIYSIILIAEPGWSLIWEKSEDRNFSESGNHGYDNNYLDMHGTFIACGPAFKTGYRTGTLRNIDVFPLLAKIFELKIEHKIDGDINNIKFILKDK